MLLIIYLLNENGRVTWPISPSADKDFLRLDTTKKRRFIYFNQHSLHLLIKQRHLFLEESLFYYCYYHYTHRNHAPRLPQKIKTNLQKVHHPSIHPLSKNRKHSLTFLFLFFFPSRSSSKIGPRVIAPKKASIAKQRNTMKKLSSGMTGRTERSLAERAGHLELLANAKKEKMKEKRAEYNNKKWYIYIYNKGNGSFLSLALAGVGLRNFHHLCMYASWLWMNYQTKNESWKKQKRKIKIIQRKKQIQN